MGITKKFDRVITIDFETYFSKDYSLRNKNLNTSEYIRHPEFKAQCVGIKVDQEPVYWVKHDGVREALASIDWSTSALLAHHTAFDGLILSHHFGIVPAYYLDTLSMARALHSNLIGAGLDEVARFYKLGNKLPNILNSTKGVRDLPDELMIQLGQYCALDVELCRMIFDKMAAGFPEDELDLIDMTVRMFCDPVLYIDIPRVEKELEREHKERQEIIEASGVSIKTLSSADMFAEELKALGIIPPSKVSPTTGSATWAFSKTDLEFMNLVYHKDERVQKLVKARLAAKSTIGETRAKRFLDVGADGKKLPVYLNYCGAHTTRWSAGNKMNLQNLKRGGELRRAIIAPPGHVIVVADSAQIEARVTAWLAQDKELLDLFRNGADVYKHMASQIYSAPIDDITKDQRFIGKIAVLGLGYGMGWVKFQHTLATGAMGPVVDMKDEECQKIVNKYRSSRKEIAALWQKMEFLLLALIRKRQDSIKIGDTEVIRYDAQNRLHLPSGLYLQYPFLTADFDQSDETYSNYKYFDLKSGARAVFNDSFDEEKGKKLYGGLLTENIVQALSRIIVGEQMLAIKRKMVDLHHPGAAVAISSGIPVGRVVTMTHDEIVICCPEQQAYMVEKLMIDEMKTPPAWCSDIPLNAEGGFDYNYSK